ncbi:MAG: sigma factor-like helix-turn-helix DNA-binding protein, partial [Pseudonocardiaceae bacterium]
TQHRIIVLRELEGLSYREIGVQMQLSSAAVESALFRARRKLENEYEQLDTGRRCARIRMLMARLAEGVESGGDRRRLERHARRCWSCRRSARQLGLDPVPERSAPRRAVALLPLPAFIRRFGAGANAPGPGAASAREGAGLIATPAVETVAQGLHKAAVVLASAIAIGGAGATLGGAGPLAVDSGRTAAEHPGGARDSGSAARTTPREKRPATGAADHRSRRGGGRMPSPDPRSGARRPLGSQTAPSPSRRFRSTLPGVPALPGLPQVDGGRVPAPSSGVRPPTLPEVPNPTLRPAPQLPRVPDAPALPGSQLGVGVDGGQVPSIAPEISGETIGALTPR